MFKARTGAGASRGKSGGSALPRRLALRDIKANKSTSALVLTLIALPMMVMVLAVTLIDSAVPTGPENAVRQLGGFDLQLIGIEYQEGAAQNPNDPFQYGGASDPEAKEKTTDVADVPAMLKVLDAGASGTVVHSGQVMLPGNGGDIHAEVNVGEISDPRFAGRYTLAAGNWGGPDSVVVNEDLAKVASVGVGDRLSLGETDYPISGIMENSSGMGMRLSGLGMSLGLGGLETPALFLVPGHPAATDLDMGYSSVFVDGMTLDLERQKALNASGIGSYVRDFIISPPSNELWGGYSGEDKQAEALFRFVAIFIIGFFVFLEVGLLAGAAFAVGAKRQRRTFALLSANGADAGTVRSIGAYSGLFLGGIGALLGMVLGLVGAWGVILWSEHRAGGFPGLHIPWVAIAALMCLGLASAVVAAWVPARSVSRHAGFTALRTDLGHGSGPKRPVFGFVLLGLGLACWAAALAMGLSATNYGQLNERSNFLMLAFVAGLGLSTVGLMLSIGHIIWVLGNAGRRLPLAGRLAVRDIQRNRGRTVPAIAALIAGTALATALATASGYSTASAGYQSSAKPPTIYDIYLMSGQEENAQVDDKESAALAAAVIEQIETSGYQPKTSSRYGSFVAGYQNPDSEETWTYPWVALLAPGSTCRYGYDDIHSGPAQGIQGVSARSEAVWRSVYAGDRFTAQYCGVDGGYSGASVRSDTSSHITDLAGLKIILGGDYTAALGEAFEKGQAIVTVPEFVTDDQRVSFGIADLGLPEDENGNSYFGNAGALVVTPLKQSFEVDAVEVLTRENGLPRIIMSEDAVVGTGGYLADSSLLVDMGRTLGDEEIAVLNKDLAKLNVGIDTGHDLSGIERLMVMLPWLSAIVAGLLVLSTAAVTTGLALADGRRDARVMEGVGASPGTRRRFGAVQSGFIALLGTGLGILLGAVPVVLLVLIMNGSMDPWLLAPLTVLLAIPPLASLIGWLMVPRRIPKARMGG